MLHLQIQMDNQDREQVNKEKGKMQRIEENYNQGEDMQTWNRSRNYKSDMEIKNKNKINRSNKEDRRYCWRNLTKYKNEKKVKIREEW